MSDKLSLFSLAPVTFKMTNGQTVYLRRLSAADRVEWLDAMAGESDAGKASLKVTIQHSAAIVCKSVCDEAGNRRFADSDVDLVMQIDAILLDELTNQILDLNAMSGKGRESAEKKSKPEEDTTASSTSSPEPLANPSA